MLKLNLFERIGKCILEQTHAKDICGENIKMLIREEKH